MSETSRKSASPSAVPQLIEIDELTRGDHWYLTNKDVCFFIGEYIVRGGWQAGHTNNLISNLKKSPEHRGSPQWPYKGRAVERAANDFRTALDISTFEGATFVPMPPSKVETDPLYDDRMDQVVERICRGTPADFRRLLRQTESLPPFHQSDQKRDIERLMQCMTVDESIAQPAPEFVFVIDDVLTTGAHFRVAKTVLQRRFGASLPIVGLFIARSTRLKPDSSTPEP